MSKKIFYIYNPKTLTYERVYPSLRQRIIVVLRHLFIGSILSIGVIVAFYFWFGSPKEELLKMENEQMQTQYKVLSKRVDAALEVLSDLQQRDDNMYRVILQAEPVNDEIRNNGIYNPSRYENLLQMSDAELVVSTSQKVDNLARQVYVQCNSMNELVKLAQGQEAMNIDDDIGSITFVGLCTDICVISNALLVKASLPEIPIIVDSACCAGVTPESHENALNAMKMCQIDIVR